MEAGYPNVKTIEGGTTALKNAGFSLEGTDHGNQ
jgi:hypothetical protein